MFDIGWQEIFIVAAIAVIIVGPRDLPRVLKSIKHYVNKARMMVREFQSGIDEVAREVDLEDIRKEAKEAANFDIQEEIKEVAKPVYSLESDLESASEDFSIESLEEKSGNVLSESNKENLSNSVDPEKRNEQTVSPSNS